MRADRYAVLGHPVAHSLSPQIHARFARLTGQDLTYEAIDVPPGGLEAFLAGEAGRALAGANVTLPHKQAALALVRECTGRARRAGAVNTLRREADGSWSGDNTDGAGFRRDLAGNLAWPVAGRRLLVIGAGGAARGILEPLLDLDPASLTVVNRTAARARELARDFGVEAGDFEAPGLAYDGVVNATAAGHGGGAFALPADTVDPRGWCYDLSYGAAAGPFLAWARAAGVARASDGLGMLVEQAAESFLRWRGVRPPAREVLAALRKPALAPGRGEAHHPHPTEQPAPGPRATAPRRSTDSRARVNQAERSGMASETSPIIEAPAELVAYLASGCKPRGRWRIGTEHEKFAYRREDLTPVPYEGEKGIEALLEAIARRGWRASREDGRIIGLYDDAGCSITLEPGGQVELSGAPLETIHQTCDEVNQHLALLKSIADPMGIGFIGLGFHPKWPRERIPWMPKARYRIMREYMPKVGDMGLDMMLRTCTVQVNLDFESEADMVEKFRIGLALQPLATALFANSPFADGRPTGYLSYRSYAWTRTDPDRSGMLPFVFEAGMGFERWLDYLLDVPMYFVRRDGRYIDASGRSFRRFLEGRLDVLPGERPTLEDFKDHLTTVFPEVRLKTFLEMRGADGGPWRRLCALPAFWVGLLYDEQAQAAAMDLVRDWDLETLAALRRDVPRLGLAARIGARSVGEVCAEVLELASLGLRNRARRNAAGDDETGFLNALYEICDSGLTPAERKLALFEGAWNHSVDPVFAQFSY